jgi:hypothetical protein
VNGNVEVDLSRWLGSCGERDERKSHARERKQFETRSHNVCGYEWAMMIIVSVKISIGSEWVR